MKIEVHPLTKRRWPDLVELFGRRGASMARGCWCMYYRKTGGSGVGSGDANRKALRALVDRGRVPGLIGYRDGRPIGWISLAPREQYAKLRRSPVMKPVDDRPVWSIVCFFVDARSRGSGVSEALLEAGVGDAPFQGAPVPEASPVGKRGPRNARFMWV